MPLILTLLITKSILKLSRWLGRGGGSALPGLAAERLDPQIASKLARSLSEGGVVVTGTNGKTTTTKMLLEILESAGKRVITNRSGSNLSRGVVSSLIEQAGLTGRLKADIGLFEVDEASMPAVCRALQPKVVVVLNLFRDQLDRYGELDKTASLIGQAISGLDADVYLNADDPLVASLGSRKDQVFNLDSKTHSSQDLAFNRIHFFGVEAAETKKLAHDLAADSNHCPVCSRALAYSRNFFGHIGHYRCPNGDFKRPTPEMSIEYRVSSIESGDKSPDTGYWIHDTRLNLQLPGLYNAYNALAAVAAASSLGISTQAAAAALERVTAAFGRVEKVELDGRTVFLLLIKNPTGFNQVIQTFFRGSESVDRRSPENPKTRPTTFDPRPPILIAINDNFADGRDVSWLWDVAAEELAGQVVDGGQKRATSGRTIIVSGIRAYDMALRLKYAGIESEVEPDINSAIKRLVQVTPQGETAYILPTYTAMLEIRRLITKQANLKGFWK